MTLCCNGFVCRRFGEPVSNQKQADIVERCLSILYCGTLGAGPYDTLIFVDDVSEIGNHYFCGWESRDSEQILL